MDGGSGRCGRHTLTRARLCVLGGGPGSSGAGAGAGVAASSAGRPTLSCEYCGKVYHHVNSLSDHRTLHRGLTTCRICGKVYSTKSTLTSHIRRVHKRSAALNAEPGGADEPAEDTGPERWRRSRPHLQFCDRPPGALSQQAPGDEISLTNEMAPGPGME